MQQRKSKGLERFGTGLKVFISLYLFIILYSAIFDPSAGAMAGTIVALFVLVAYPFGGNWLSSLLMNTPKRNVCTFLMNNLPRYCCCCCALKASAQVQPNADTSEGRMAMAGNAVIRLSMRVFIIISLFIFGAMITIAGAGAENGSQSGTLSLRHIGKIFIFGSMVLITYECCTYLEFQVATATKSLVPKKTSVNANVGSRSTTYSSSSVESATSTVVVDSSTA